MAGYESAGAPGSARYYGEGAIWYLTPLPYRALLEQRCVRSLEGPRGGR